MHPSAPVETTRGRGAAAAALVRAARPQQWSKNFLVFVPALMVADHAGGRWLVDLGVTGAAYCLAASGIYLVNDVQDASLDRSHPAKRLRPVASGAVSAKVAAVAGAALMVAGLAVTTTLGSVRLVGVLAAYLAVALSYCFVLKHLLVFDLAANAACFGLRTASGAVAVRIDWPLWLALATCCAALFVGAGKRYSEARTFGTDAVRTRPVLARYSASYLRFVWTLAAAATVVGYAAWAFDAAGSELARWSAVPVALAVLRYAVPVDAGLAESPEQVIRGDPALLGLIGVWVALFLVRAWQ